MVLRLISFVAAFTSIISLLPQIHRTYKTRSAQDLSMLMLLNFLLCSVSWVAYGVITNASSVWITNVFMTLFSVTLIVFKLRFR